MVGRRGSSRVAILKQKEEERRIKEEEERLRLFEEQKKKKEERERRKLAKMRTLGAQFILEEKKRNRELAAEVSPGK